MPRPSPRSVAILLAVALVAVAAFWAVSLLNNGGSNDGVATRTSTPGAATPTTSATQGSVDGEPARRWTQPYGALNEGEKSAEYCASTVHASLMAAAVHEDPRWDESVFYLGRGTPMQRVYGEVVEDYLERATQIGPEATRVEFEGLVLLRCAAESPADWPEEILYGPDLTVCENQAALAFRINFFEENPVDSVRKGSWSLEEVPDAAIAALEDPHLIEVALQDGVEAAIEAARPTIAVACGVDRAFEDSRTRWVDYLDGAFAPSPFYIQGGIDPQSDPVALCEQIVLSGLVARGHRTGEADPLAPTDQPFDVYFGRMSPEGQVFGSVLPAYLRSFQSLGTEEAAVELRQAVFSGCAAAQPEWPAEDIPQPQAPREIPFCEWASVEALVHTWGIDVTGNYVYEGTKEYEVLQKLLYDPNVVNALHDWGVRGGLEPARMAAEQSCRESEPAPRPDDADQSAWDPDAVTEQQTSLYLADLQTLDPTRFSNPAEADFHLEVGMGICMGFATLGTIENLDAVASSIEGHDSQMYMATVMTAATARLCPDLGTALDGYLVASGNGDLPRFGGIQLALQERLYP